MSYTGFLNTFFLKVFIQFFLKYLSQQYFILSIIFRTNWIKVFAANVTSTENQVPDLFALVKCIKCDFEKKCH